MATAPTFDESGDIAKLKAAYVTNKLSVVSQLVSKVQGVLSNNWQS